MTRKVNAATLAHIKASEGLRLEAYPDPGSRDGTPWTVGYGSTLGVKKGDKITEAEAEIRLKRDLTNAENAVERVVKVPLNDNQFGALVSLAFNIGVDAFAKSTLVRLLNQGNYEAVPAQIRQWRYNDGAIMQGLVNRRAAEVKLWLTPAAATPVHKPSDFEPAPAEPPVADTPAKKGNLAFILIVLALALVAAVFLFFLQR